MKLRTTVQISSAIQKKPPLKREDSFLKRFSTRQIPETQVIYIFVTIHRQNVKKNNARALKFIMKLFKRMQQNVCSRKINLHNIFLGIVYGYNSDILITICILYYQ